MAVASLENIGSEFKTLLTGMSKGSVKEVNKFYNKMPTALERRAKAFYGKVLKRRSGNLIRSIKGWKIKTGSSVYNVGLRAGGEVVKYAWIQHEGGFIPPHFIRPRVAKALRWFGGRLTKGGRISKAKGNVHFSKGHHVRGSYIKPKKYLEFPLRKEAQVQLDKLTMIIGRSVIK